MRSIHVSLCSRYRRCNNKVCKRTTQSCQHNTFGVDLHFHPGLNELRINHISWCYCVIFFTWEGSFRIEGCKRCVRSWIYIILYAAYQHYWIDIGVTGLESHPCSILSNPSFSLWLALIDCTGRGTLMQVDIHVRLWRRSHRAYSFTKNTQLRETRE